MGEAVSFQNARGERLAGLLLETESKVCLLKCRAQSAPPAAAAAAAQIGRAREQVTHR